MAKLSFIVKADRTPVTKLIQSIDELEKKVRHIQNSDLNFNKWLKAFDDLQKKVQEKKDSLEKLKSQMLSLDITKMPHTKITLETNYAKVRKEYEELANEVGQASLKFDRAYKGMLDDLLLAEKNTDSITSKMIEQKKVVSDLTSEIKRLNAEKKLSTSQTQKDTLAEQAEKTKVKLEEERATLNKLRESQEKAKLTVKGLKDEVRGYEKVTGKVAGTQAEANMVFDRLESSLVRLGGLAVLQKFSSDVIKATGDMQQLSVALSTILQSKSKADSLIDEIKEFAVKTPFDLTEVGDATKQMLAYGSSSENVIKEMSMLGDVAAGLQIPIGQLIYLYGTLRTQGKAMTVDIRQFAGRGIPIYEELAKVLGTTTDKVGEFVTDGKVGFAEVEKAFQSMTSEGGKFYNMLENAAGTWPQQIAQIGDSLVTKLNEFGNKHKEIFELGIGTTADLVDSLDSVINIISGLVTAYGSYKAILIATNAVQRAGAFIENIRLIGMMRKELGLATAAQQAFNTASKANVYTTLISVLLGLGMAVYMFTKRTNEATEANNSLKRVSKNASEEYVKQASTIDRINGVLKSETASLTLKKEKLKELKGIIPGYNAELDNEGKLINNNTEAIKAYLTQLEKQIKLKAAQEELEELYRKKRLQEKDIKVKEKNVEREKKNVPDVVSGGDLGIEAQRNALSRVADAESALKQANAELKITEKNIGEIQNEIEKTSISTFDNKKLETHNKKYWEDKKKEAEAARDALDISERNSKKWNEYTKQIQEAQTQIDKYSSPSKQQKEFDKRLNQQEQLSEELLSLRRKNQQDEINLMKEGSEKKLAQIDLDYQKELDAIEKQRDEWNKSQKGKLTDEQETQLLTSEENAFKIYEKNVKEVNEAKLEADRKAWQEYFIEFGNYQEKRKNLIQKYDDEIAKLQMDSPEYASKTAEKGQALEQLDEQFGKSTKTMADLFEDASNKSVSAIQSIIDKYETLVKYMSGTKKSDGTDVTLDELKSVGFTDSDIERLENGEIKIKDVIDAIKGLKNELKEKSPWQSFRTELGKGIDTIKNADGDTQKLGQGITDIGNAVASFIPALSEFGSNIANIFGVDDSKITGIIDAVGGLGQTAVGVGQIMSGDIFGGAMSAVSGISSIVSALDGLFGADYSRYDEMKAQYENINSIWDELISKKKEYIDISYGTEALKAGEEALDIIKKSQDAQRNLARTLAQSGASAGSHSIAYRQNAALGGYASELYRYVHQNGNYNDITNALLGASAEQLQKVKEQMPELWAGLDGDFREHLNNIISGAEQAKEVLEQMKEAVAGISFDEFRSGYIDLLSDLDSTNEDFADNFEKYLQKSIFESLLANKYKERIQSLYDTWVEYGKDGLTLDEVQKLRDMQEQLSESLLAERDKIMSDFGFTTNGSESKTSSKRGFGTEMTHEDAGELSGRFTALQIAGEEIKNQNAIQVQSLNLLTMKSEDIFRVNTEIRNVADDTRDLIAQSYLELVQISENTGAIIKPIQQMQKDIAEVKKNTSKL